MFLCIFFSILETRIYFLTELALNSHTFRTHIRDVCL